MAAGAIAGGVFGAVTSYFSIKEKNKALAAQAKFNIQKFTMQQNLSNFAQSNNLQRAGEITTQISQEAAEAKRDVGVQERKAIGAEVVRRGEGLTAGASVVRSVDDIIAQGNKAKAATTSAAEQATMNVNTQVRQANASEQGKKINAYSSMLIENAQLAAQQVTGIGALLQIGTQALSGAQAGGSLESSVGGFLQADEWNAGIPKETK